MPKIRNGGLGPGQVPLLSKTVNLTAADILALRTTPVTIVPAPGVGNIISGFEIVVVYIFGTRPYAQLGGSSQFCYASAGNPTVGGPPLTNILNQGNSASLSGALGNQGVAPILPGADNQPLIITPGIDLRGGTIQTTTLGAGGAGYAANDTGTLSNGNGDATYKVLTVDGGGAVLTYSITDPGTGYIVENNSPTATGGAQPGVGAGFTVNITAVQNGDGTLKVVTYYQIIPVP